MNAPKRAGGRDGKSHQHRLLDTLAERWPGRLVDVVGCLNRVGHHGVSIWNGDNLCGHSGTQMLRDLLREMLRDLVLPIKSDFSDNS